MAAKIVVGLLCMAGVCMAIQSPPVSKATLTQQRLSGSVGLMRLRGGAPAKTEVAKPKYTLSSVIAAVVSPKTILVLAVLGALSQLKGCCSKKTEDPAPAPVVKKPTGFLGLGCCGL
eukprot:CAMPEP_0172162904 /NCGR_PEP_ID=MMETSP1050-20130122/6960_1 /TAXON_ID=233186 /ORGANISM="Cryptomonas curvata, Strain CCAP979/52" /LENGTH=116 /DNA_ID=CAMNT_0012833005 /DNA_START=183 /DNA_END=533 /DNA_ORIENTATION=+